MPFFTIVIATYNSEYFLERAILSVLNQDFNDYEIVIVDGKSTDLTMSIVNKYSSKIKKVISEKDNGIYDAWNKGIKISEGEWVMFIGSDDILLENALNDYYNYIAEINPEIEFISSLVQLIDFNGKIIRTIGKAWNWNKFKKYMCVAHVGSLHRKTLFLNYGNFDSNYKITGDYEFLLRPNNHLKASFLEKVTAKMQIGGVSLNNKSFVETYNAKTLTGGRNKFIAAIELIKAYLFHQVRKYI